MNDMKQCAVAVPCLDRGPHSCYSRSVQGVLNKEPPAIVGVGERHGLRRGAMVSAKHNGASNNSVILFGFPGFLGIVVLLCCQHVIAAQPHEMGLEIVCEKLACQGEIGIDFLHEPTGVAIAQISISTGTMASVPASIMAKIENGELQPEEVLVAPADATLVASRVTLGSSRNRVIRLEVLRATTLRAKLDIADRKGREDVQIDWGLLKLWPADDPEETEHLFRARCPVTDSALTCRVPIGVWDLRLEFRRHSPIVLWDVEFEEDVRTTLGPLRTETGATLFGSVEVHASDDPSRDAMTTIELTPSRALDSSLAALRPRRIRALQRTVVVEADRTYTASGVSADPTSSRRSSKESGSRRFARRT